MVFAQGGNIGSNHDEGARPVEGSEAAGNFLLDLDHAQVLLGKVVGKGDAEVGEEGEDVVRMVLKAVEQVLGLGLLWASTPFLLGSRRFRIGPAALRDQGIIALPPGRELRGAQARGSFGLLLGDQAVHVQEQVVELAGPGLIELVEEEGQLAEQVCAAESVFA